MSVGIRVGALALVFASACGGGAKSPVDGGAPMRDVGLTVNDARARACDVLITEGQRQVTGVTFDASVKGQWSRWEPRVAIAFTAKEDKAFRGVGKLTVRVPQDGADFSSIDVTCYDRAGAKLAGAKVTIK